MFSTLPFVFWPPDATWLDCCTLVFDEVAVGVIEDDFALDGVLNHPGFQVVAHKPRGPAAEGVEHRCVTQHPERLLHIKARLNQRTRTG